jgi:hypothetical protein
MLIDAPILRPAREARETFFHPEPGECRRAASPDRSAAQQTLRSRPTELRTFFRRSLPYPICQTDVIHKPRRSNGRGGGRWGSGIDRIDPDSARDAGIVRGIARQTSSGGVVNGREGRKARAMIQKVVEGDLSRPARVWRAKFGQMTHHRIGYLQLAIFFQSKHGERRERFGHGRDPIDGRGSRQQPTFAVAVAVSPRDYRPPVLCDSERESGDLGPTHQPARETVQLRLPRYRIVGGNRTEART